MIVTAGIASAGVADSLIKVCHDIALAENTSNSSSNGNIFIFLTMERVHEIP